MQFLAQPALIPLASAVKSKERQVLVIHSLGPLHILNLCGLTLGSKDFLVGWHVGVITALQHCKPIICTMLGDS